MTLEQTLSCVRPSIRAEHAYRVGLEQHISIKLNQNENAFDIPDVLKQQIIAEFCATSWNRYTNDQPILLQKSLSEYLDFEEEGILVANGSNEMMATLGSVFIQKGSSVVLPTPLFSLYEKIARVEEANLIKIAPRADLSHDTEALLEAVKTHQPALTVLGSPNNPTGLSMTDDEIRVIIEASSGIVLLDEAYIDFVGDGRGKQTWIAQYPNLIILRTFSKAFGLAGLRLGYILGQASLMQEIMKVRIPFLVNRLAETAGCTMLAQKSLVQERVATILSETKRLYEALKNMENVEVLPTTANFMIFKTPMASKALVAAMSEEGILLRDMSGYPELPHFVRVSAGTPEENSRFITQLPLILEKNCD